MPYPFPFYTDQPETAGASVYHTHPRCRVAQRIAAASRVAGTGVGRQECPFCFLFGQFQLSQPWRQGLVASPAASSALSKSAPPLAAAMQGSYQF